MREFILKIDEKNKDQTVGKLIKSELKISARLLTKLKKGDYIKVNDKHVTVRYTVSVGDELKIIMPEEQSQNVVPVDIPLNIIYEDNDILIVNKPCDMPVHPSTNNFKNTLGNAVMFYYKDVPFVYRPINRLDKDTTGMVIIAKTPQASHNLSRQMQNNTFKKTYLAVLNSVPKEKEGIIDKKIARESESIIKRCVRDDGKRAITEYKIIKEIEGKCVAEIKLHTGRTHQIRVHFASIGCPLYADFLYGEEIPGKKFRLHCHKLEFLHPVTKEKMEFICNPPENFLIF